MDNKDTSNEIGKVEEIDWSEKIEGTKKSVSTAKPRSLDEIQSDASNKHGRKIAKSVPKQESELYDYDAELRNVTGYSNAPLFDVPDEVKIEAEEDFLGTESKKSKKTGLNNFFALLKKHKVLTSIVAIVLAFTIAITGTINYFLGKINIVDDDKTTPVFSVEQTTLPQVLTLATGEVINTSGLVQNADGTYTLPDGRKINADGTIWKPDGTVIFYDGSYLMPNGTAVLADGTTFYENQTLVFQTGKFYGNTGTKVDNDGYITFKNGIVTHITAFTCTDDAVCASKQSLIKSLKHTAEGSWSVFDEKKGNSVILNADNNNSSTDLPPGITDEDEGFDKALADSSDKLADSDEKIKRNFNDKKIWYNEDVVNILLMGIDNGSKNYPYGRSDAMIVISANKKTKAVKMVSFSRAVYSAIQGYDNTRLSHAHGLGGASLAIDTIQKNYKIRIDNYVETGFDTFKQIIDVLGGITIELTKAEASALKKKLKATGQKYNGAGTYTLNGDIALNYVRLRKIDTDRERTGRQRKVLMNIASKVKTLNVFQLTALANKILPLITTDMSKSEILSQLGTVGSYLNGNIEQSVIPKKSTALTLIDQFEVLLIDWDYEVKGVHDLFYGDVTPKYYEY